LKIGGKYKIAAPRQKVWDALMDPDILAAAIPGAERCVEIVPGKFQVEIKVGIGIIRGRFSGIVETTDLNPPASQQLILNGEGTGGWIKGGGALMLREVDGNTEIDVDGEALTGGVLARVGQRMIGNASKTMMGQFFTNLNREVTR
jgi:carbon monoxide dehydrogenase subunit G